MNKLPKARNSDIVVQKLENEVLVYDLRINKAFCLNETSKLVWQMCDGKNTVAEISDKLSQQLKELVSEDLVHLAIEQFNKDGLLENDTGEEFNRHFGGLNRREVIRKVGFASMIALPLISSIVAPSAAMAQSGPVNVAVLGACTSPTNCQTGLSCKSCSDCTNNPACCANTNSFTSGPGVVVSCTTSQGQCDTVAAMVCCTGTGTHTPGPTAPCGFTGSCTCN